MTDRVSGTRIDAEGGPDQFHYFEEMLRGAYDHGTTLYFRNLALHFLGRRDGQQVWRVERACDDHAEGEQSGTGTAGVTDNADTTRPATDEVPTALNLGAIRSTDTLREELLSVATAESN
jgi:hypothetical protein